MRISTLSTRRSLTSETVRQIICDYQDGASYEELAAKYNTSRSILSDIIGGRKYRDVTGGKIRRLVRNDNRYRYAMPDATVVAMRERYRNEVVTMTQISNEFGLPLVVVRNAIRGDTYRHIPDPVTSDEVNGGKRFAAVRFSKFGDEEVLWLRNWWATDPNVRIGDVIEHYVKKDGIKRSTTFYRRVITGKDPQFAHLPVPDYSKRPTAPRNLSDGEVLSIIHDYACDDGSLTQKEMAKMYKVTPSVISKVLGGTLFTHITNWQKTTRGCTPQDAMSVLARKKSQETGKTHVVIILTDENGRLEPDVIQMDDFKQGEILYIARG